MLNFKFIKFAAIFFVLAFFVAGYSVASARFITIYPEEEDSSLDNGMTAAVIDAIPAKIDGEIVNCFDYYRFPSIQASFETAKEFYEPGQTIYFKGELINENNYPIADGYLFVRIARFNENYIQEGHDIVDEFFAKSGPQGREKFYLEGNEKKGVVFSWNVPENLPEGIYAASFSFAVGKKLNLAGLSFTNEVDAGSTGFEVRKSAIGARRVFLEKSSFALNGNRYDHIGFSPQFNNGAKVEVSGKLKNETPQKENIKLVYDLYYWDGLDEKNKISSRSEDITVAPNSSYSFKYIIPKMDETVYFLRVTAIAGNNQKSIVNLRFVSEQERPRINFFSPLKFPVLKGETMTNFACFHNTADKAGRGKMTMNVFDQSGDKVQTLGYEGEITGKIMAVKKDAAAPKNYDYLKMVASVAGADGREADSYEMVYDCKNMNPENQECARIQEEKAKAAADASNKSLGKKGLAFGIAALMAILAIAALLRKFLLNKTKPSLISLFFAFVVGSTVFLAGGADNRVLAKNVPVSEVFSFPEGECTKSNSIDAKFGNICISSGKVQVKHWVIRDNTSNNLTAGEKVNFSYDPIEPFWYAVGSANDSPYGAWCKDVEKCEQKRNDTYEEVEDRVDAENKSIRTKSIKMTFLAEKPKVDITSSDPSVLKCDGMACEALKKGNATVAANIHSFFARPWIRATYNGITYDCSVKECDSRIKFKEGQIYDVKFKAAKLTWDITVDPPPVECEASFSPVAITVGGSTAFSWETKYDEDGIIPILCDGDISDINDSGDSGYPSGSWINLKPTKTQTCVATASNSNGPKSCSAKVTVNEPPRIPPLSVTCSASPNPVALNTPVTFAATVSGGATPYNYTWSDADPVSGAPQTATKSYSTDGKKEATIEITDSGNPAQKEKKSCPVTVIPPVIPPIVSQPQNFTASGICRKVNLLWDYSSEKIASYKITRDETMTFTKDMNINITPGFQNSYTDNSATDSEKTYSYTIKACDSGNKCSVDAGPSEAMPTGGICVVGDGGCTGDSSQSCGIDQNSRPANTSSCSGSQSRVCANSSWGDWGSCGITTCACNGGYTWNSTTQICDVVSPDYYNLTLKKIGDGKVKLYSWRATPVYTYDWNDYAAIKVGDNYDFADGKTVGLAKDWWFKMTAAPDSGSYFSGWSGCTASDPKGTAPSSDENACFVTMNSDNKTATVTFGSSSGPTGPTGGSSVKAYISAQKNPVTDGNSTVVDWTSDNATSCEQIDSGLGSGDYKDTGWISASDTALGNYTTANFTTSGGARTYTITCANGSQTSDPASVTVSVGDYTGSPSASIWADPQSIGYKKTSLIKWLSSNVLPGCSVYSGTSYFGGGNNNLTGQTTGKLSGNTVYKIKCQGFDYSNIQRQTTVVVAKPVSNFTLTNPTGGKLVATIVEGLSANSNSIALALSGEAIDNVSLSASIPAISGAKAQFSSDEGTTWSDTLSVDISAISQVKVKVIKIPGATPAGTYNTAVTATDIGTGGKTKKLNVNLRVDRVSSEWKEF